MKIRLQPLLLFISFLSFYGFSQNQSDLRGRIIDEETGDPISYATIRIAETTLGLIANIDGTFVLPGHYKSNNVTLIISSIGYATLEIDTDQFDSELINQISLSIKIEALEAVELNISKRERVEGLDFLTAERIVRQALYSIQFNHPKDPYSYVSYYRDYQLVDNEYKNLNEAIVKTFDQGIRWPSSNNNSIASALLFYNTNLSFPVDSLLLKSSYGLDKYMSNNGEIFMATPLKNELELLKLHNPLRNFDQATFSFIYNLQKDFVNNHNFKINQLVYEDDRLLYEIAFVTKASGQYKFKGAGKIYIAKESYAIHRLDYGVYRDKDFSIGSPGSIGAYQVRNYNDFTKTKVDFTFNRSSSKFEVSIKYTQRNKVMYPSYITFNNDFEYDYPTALQVSKLSFDEQDSAFLIVFDKKVDSKSIKRKSNYSFKYQGQKLIVTKAEMVDDYTLKVFVVWKVNRGINNALNFDDFTYSLKRIKDVDGGTIHDVKTVIGEQYRELFTQEILELEADLSNLSLIDPKRFLHESTINISNINTTKYWVNTPLKSKE